MVDIAATQTLGFAANARQALDDFSKPALETTILSPDTTRLRNIAPIQNPARLALPDGLGTLGTSAKPADISIDDARALLNNALSAAYKIRDALESLSDSVKIAAATSLTASISGIAPDGTRLSGINIQASATRITDAIDTLVANTSVAGVNLISNSSRPIRIQTSDFGGRVSVNPQPLDSIGLNIQNLDTVNRADAQNSQYRLDIAVATTLTRISTLETLASTLRFNSIIDRNLSNALASGDGLSSRGFLIDVNA